METLTRKPAPLSVERVTAAQPAHAAQIASTYEKRGYHAETHKDARELAHILAEPIAQDEDGYRFPRSTFQHAEPRPAWL